MVVATEKDAHPDDPDPMYSTTDPKSIVVSIRCWMEPWSAEARGVTEARRPRVPRDVT